VLALTNPGPRVSGAALVGSLKGHDEPALCISLRVRAADSIFNHAAKAIEIEDIEARLAELERIAASNQAR
jgi:hypothetical protein